MKINPAFLVCQDFPFKSSRPEDYISTDNPVPVGWTGEPGQVQGFAGLRQSKGPVVFPFVIV